MHDSGPGASSSADLVSLVTTDTGFAGRGLRRGVRGSRLHPRPRPRKSPFDTSACAAHAHELPSAGTFRVQQAGIADAGKDLYSQTFSWEETINW